MQTSPLSVGIFAKAPVPGLAKTRLIPRLGPEGAARLQSSLTRRAVKLARESNIGPVSLWCTPTTRHPLFQALAGEFGVALRDQAEGDLGARMCDALCQLTRDSPALLIGTDSVVLESRHLINAANLLRAECDAVFIPVEDGGYLLVGVRQCQPALFQGLAWNTSAVMEETRKRATHLGLAIAELETLWDIDVPEDYDRALRLGCSSNALSECQPQPDERLRHARKQSRHIDRLCRRF
ncbi:MAG TPA: TIGR04282 family arsenosugar biosynthesis glycosyltransferase [Micropepsaceae bacterium]|nr:TIGR04282 family arsenosugar biosynthesis glycosyltransferase [Micropepsaceae bacterium]